MPPEGGEVLRFERAGTLPIPSAHEQNRIFSAKSVAAFGGEEQALLVQAAATRKAGNEPAATPKRLVAAG